MNELKSVRQTVISTRVRLARNLEGYPFPSHLKDEKQAKEIIRQVSSALSRQGEFSLFHMDGVTEERALSMKENHLISQNLINNRRNAAVLIDGEKSVSIMINEEDHLREQCIVKGFDLDNAYGKMSKIDEKIAGAMKFAYDEQLGYLTACPTNLGTGMRASVMLFLPALAINGIIGKVVQNITRLGLTVRGIYGEGSKAEGYVYQISNEVTLGVTEEEILSQVRDVVEKVCELEACERYALRNGEYSLEMRDNCLRSYGILTNCAKLTCDELTKYAANVKLGVCLGYLAAEDLSGVDDWVVKMRPSNINPAEKRLLTPTERDVYRARETGNYFRKNISVRQA